MDQSSIWFAATKAFGTDDLQIVKVKSDWFVFSDRGTFSAHSQNGRIAFTEILDRFGSPVSLERGGKINVQL